jgi:hypothetical protein
MKKLLLSLLVTVGMICSASAADSRIGPDQPHGSTDPIPEPSTYALFGLGVIGLVMVLRRNKVA